MMNQLMCATLFLTLVACASAPERSSSSTERAPNQEFAVSLKDTKNNTEVKADATKASPEFSAASAQKRVELQKAIANTETEINEIIAKGDTKPPTPPSAKAATSIADDLDSVIDRAAIDRAAVDSTKQELADKELAESRAKAEAALKQNAQITQPTKDSIAPQNTTLNSNLISKRVVGAVPTKKAFGWMKNGNLRFVKGRLRADGLTAADRARTAKGQAPHAAVVTCSDSRMVPELIFDQKIGEIYTVRVVDLSIALNIQASLDFAINSLGTNLVILLGSESCGNEQKVEFLHNELLERSAILRDAIIAGDVTVVRGFYNLTTGSVEFR